ncbi:TPA: aminotransferase class I/II-fold pyridoxal phosphate-dependent enzyme [Candidatus Avacholeplasma faecigallinarum]|nr:aminotransferase class I/II-fold pyridoxal phosphate-dependent enzyme [Candidatus Avacholeplasma faecigallinarum]
MKIQLNKEILNVEQSEIRKFNDYAQGVGANVILTLGEPDFYTPKEISDSCIEAINNHKTKYGPTLGFYDLRKKICEFELKTNNVNYTPDEVIITHGSTEALTSAFFTMLNPGDEVIIPNPSYPMYRQIIQYKQGKVVTIDTTSSNFQITKEQLDKAITSKTKCIILTSPNNPTGCIYSDETLENVYNAVKDKPIFVLCDDVYNQIVYTKRKPGFVKYQDIKDQIIVCQSYSKSYAMPGWRCGYMLASKEFCIEAAKIHQYMIVALNTFLQDAMIKALDYDPTDMVKSYQQRRDYIYDRLVKMGLDVVKPEGAFYIFPSIKKLGISSLEFCKHFAQEYKVAIIPGYCFEADDYIRLSYCVSMQTIITACDRLEEFINKLRNNK